MPSSSENTPAPARNKKTASLIGLVCLAPLIAACLLYFGMPHLRMPRSTASYGTLIIPQRPIPDTLLVRTEDNRQVPLHTLKGHWLLLSVDHSNCSKRCVEKLYFMRQVRAAQGAQRTRVVPLWLRVDDAAIPSEVVEAYRETRLLTAPVDALKAWLPTQAHTTIFDHLYLIDPNGHAMMYFHPNPNPGKIRADVAKLLKWSGIG